MTVNKTRKSVSIVIPAYNEERHLRACLQSVAAQTVQPYEVIVVDNNSTDRTAQVAQEFPFVRVVTESHQGRVFARNAGFNAAKGDILGRVDADIVLPATWVEHLQDFYADPQHTRSAWSGMGYFHNVPLPSLVSWAYGHLAFGFNRLLTGHYTLWGSNMAITQAQWQAVRKDVCLNNDIHEDLDLAIHIHDAGYTIAYDAGMQVRAEMRRVTSDRHELWGYLLWWPRTLKIHHKKSWLLCWLVGALGLYLATYVLLVVSWFVPPTLRRSFAPGRLPE